MPADWPSRARRRERTGLPGGCSPPTRARSRRRSRPRTSLAPARPAASARPTRSAPADARCGAGLSQRPTNPPATADSPQEPPGPSKAPGLPGPAPMPPSTQAAGLLSASSPTPCCVRPRQRQRRAPDPEEPRAAPWDRRAHGLGAFQDASDRPPSEYQHLIEHAAVGAVDEPAACRDRVYTPVPAVPHLVLGRPGTVCHCCTPQAAGLGDSGGVDARARCTNGCPYCLVAARYLWFLPLYGGAYALIHRGWQRFLEETTRPKQQEELWNASRRLALELRDALAGEFRIIDLPVKNPLGSGLRWSQVRCFELKASSNLEDASAAPPIRGTRDSMRKNGNLAQFRVIGAASF